MTALSLVKLIVNISFILDLKKLVKCCISAEAQTSAAIDPLNSHNALLPGCKPAQMAGGTLLCCGVKIQMMYVHRVLTYVRTMWI